MDKDDNRCAEAKMFAAIDEAFRSGDLGALRRALPDPSVVPNGLMPVTVGPCLVYAIYHSPLPFIRDLLEIGADPNPPVDDGFPPLIAALTTAREVPGARRRTDVADVIRLLLSFGADPNQRGINDYTPLHMAVVARDPLLAQILLDGGADPDLRTRIDDYETPLEMAKAAGLADVARVLERRGQPLRQRLRSGVTLLVDVPGSGDPVRRQHVYRVRLRIWLRQGEPISWQKWWGPDLVARLENDGAAKLEDEGTALLKDVRIDRRSLVNGLFYGVEGMRVGGMRRLEIAPHMAYGERGVPGVIPPNALLIAEITVLDAVPQVKTFPANPDEGV